MTLPTLPKRLTVIESPKVLALGASRAYAIDFSRLGTPTSKGDTICYFEDGEDVSETVLSGEALQAGDEITLEEFTPNAAGKYRLIHTCSIQAQDCYGIVDVGVFAVIPPDTDTRTPGAGAYATVEGVAALVPRYSTRTGTFDDTTRPTVQEVVRSINEISALIDVMLAQEGFVIPVTNATVISSLSLFVRQECAAIVEGINGSGRFGPTTKTGGNRGRFALVFDDVKNFIEMNAFGFEKAGAARDYSLAEGIGYRDTDEAGDAIHPIRQRKEFGTIWTNWDQ